MTRSAQGRRRREQRRLAELIPNQLIGQSEQFSISQFKEWCNSQFFTEKQLVALIQDLCTRCSRTEGKQYSIGKLLDIASMYLRSQMIVAPKVGPVCELDLQWTLFNGLLQAAALRHCKDEQLTLLQSAMPNSANGIRCWICATVNQHPSCEGRLRILPDTVRVAQEHHLLATMLLCTQVMPSLVNRSSEPANLHQFDASVDESWAGAFHHITGNDIVRLAHVPLMDAVHAHVPIEPLVLFVLEYAVEANCLANVMAFPADITATPYKLRSYLQAALAKLRSQSQPSAPSSPPSS